MNRKLLTTFLLWALFSFFTSEVGGGKFELIGPLLNPWCFDLVNVKIGLSLFFFKFWISGY